MSKMKPFLPLLMVIMLGLACNLPSSPSPSLTPTPKSTQVVSETPASTTALSSPTAEIQTQPTTVTRSPTEELFPAGIEHLKIVYIKEGDLWVWMKDQTRQITSTSLVYDLRISPDGQMVAYSRLVDDYHLELRVVDIDGKRDHLLVGVSDLDNLGSAARDPNAMAIVPFHFEWIPGTHIVAFNTQQVFQGPGLVLLNDLHLVNADTSRLTTLLPSGKGGEFFFSPDGQQIAITTPTTISLINADGSNRREVLTYPEVITYSEYRYYARPVWSPDSTFLRLALPPEEPLGTPVKPTSLWIIPTDGSPAKLVGNVLAVPFFEVPVAFSPDMSYLIYLKEVGAPAENRRELHIAKPDGSGDWIYQQGPMMRFEGWSLDSLHFVYGVGERQEKWLGRVDAPAQPLAGGPSMMSLRWITGRHYVYLKDNVGAFQLFLVSLNGEVMLLDTLASPPSSYDFTR